MPPKRPFPSVVSEIEKKRKMRNANKKQSILRRKHLDETFSTLEREGIVEIVDLFDIFCPTDECSYFGKNQTLLYRDQNSHPSAKAARLSAPLIKSIFEKNY